MLTQDDAILLDVKDTFATALVQRLNMYKLRADVAIAPTTLNVLRGLADAPVGAFADPRHPALGWRAYTEETGVASAVNWDAIRVAHCIPETGIELVANEGYILESRFEELSGVDFKKGCYVGQEIVARMKHKTELRKGFITVSVAGSAPVGTEILANDRPIGTLYTQSDGRGIAYMRFDRATGDMLAGTAKLQVIR